MRRISTFLVILGLILGGCAAENSSRTEGTTSFTGGTGYKNKAGVPYVTPDERMPKALAEDAKPVIPSKPASATPPAPKAKSEPAPLTLVDRLNEYEISRFTAGEKRPSRFGDSTYTIKIFFVNQPNATVFTGEFRGAKDHYTIAADSGKYTLRGTFDDTIPRKTDGDLILTEKATKTSVRILYRAYKAKLRVHEDRSKVLAQGIEAQLKHLRENTFGWMNNWSVVHGKSFYLADIIKMTNQVDDGNTLDPVFAFKGESLETGDQDHPAISLNPDVSNDVSLIGNSTTSQRRWFETRLVDAQTKEENEVIVDFEGENTSDDTSVARDNDEPPVEDSTVVRPPTTPDEPVVSGSAYLQSDKSLQRTARMIADFNRNRKSRSVNEWIANYTNRSSNKKRWRKTELVKFYKYANPFRGMIESIGRTYDVSPAFAYVTVIESPYFTGGRYQISIHNPKSTAEGPFQILDATADSLGMLRSERRFFAPSACGAAKYFAQLADQFSTSDSTLGILGYYQGDGGAARAVLCTVDRSLCQGKNFGRYKRLAKDYSNITFADMDEVHSIPQDQLDYVNKKLAIYFISEDMAKYGFSIDSSAPRKLPNNNSVMPSNPLKDPVCRSTMQNMVGI